MVGLGEPLSDPFKRSRAGDVVPRGLAVDRFRSNDRDEFERSLKRRRFQAADRLPWHGQAR